MGSKVMSERISAVCHKQHRQGVGVLPPQVCPYCFGCPIATIVVGVGNMGSHMSQRDPDPIPETAVASVEAWLAKLEGGEE